MRFETFSEKQALALTWWRDSSPYEDYDAIICDGAVRSGKTVCMGISLMAIILSRGKNKIAWFLLVAEPGEAGLMRKGGAAE